MKHVLAALATAALIGGGPSLAQSAGSGIDGLLAVDGDDELGRPDPALFREPPLTVHAGPAAEVAWELPAGVMVRDFEVSPAGDQVAVITEDPAHRQELAFWRYDTLGPVSSLEVPAGTLISSVTWRPDGEWLFMLAGSRILKIDPTATSFAATTVYTSKAPLRRLVVGTRPFEGSWKGGPAYRLFFGQQLPGGGFTLLTVSEDGKVPYTVVGPVADPRPAPGAGEERPNTTQAPSALPLGFHPAGNLLIWEDAQGCLHKKAYADGNWGNSAVLPAPCGAKLAYAPNGAATLAWTAGAPGLRVHGLIDGTDQTLLSGYQLISMPSQAPDGKGIVGLTRDGERRTLRYLPLSLPLADVANAWMFLRSADDQQRFVRDRGLLRRFAGAEQLYQLYDSESYPNVTGLARPYLVTTDLFWEIYGAAFDGLYIVVERERAMPAFRRFVEAADAALGQTDPKSGLATAFGAARAVLTHGEAGNPEAQRILAARDTAASPLGGLMDYTQLAPRGHYRTDAEQRYFRAMRYLTLPQLRAADVAALRRLPPAVAEAAADWIGSYQPFVAASRRDLVWGDAARTPIALDPGEPAGVGLFPQSWAWDNEALNHVVYHDKWPRPERITGSQGERRLLPSGLDLAATFGNTAARGFLGEAGVFAAYPNLAEHIAATGRRFAADTARRAPASLYEKWLAALATQWADAASVPEVSGRLWAAKRLQTGLGSWATLRHSTILVNDQAAAEAGEGGFEEIVLAPPRGYVEPDPATFGAIADLFEATATMVRSTTFLAGSAVRDATVRGGIVGRLNRARDDARQFQAIARKELAGQPLDAEDYAAIAYVGGTVEHSFLVFFSLSNPAYALSVPDPMMKVADVAHALGAGPGAGVAVLEAAVGRPLEWDQIIPFQGRHEIVKGAVYSYYELGEPHPIDDVKWRQRVDSQPPPPWIAPFLSSQTLPDAAMP